MKNILLIFLLFFCFLSLNAQIKERIDAPHKIDLQVGSSNVTFLKTRPLPILVCSTASCEISETQRNITTLTFGGSIAKRISKKHYLGMAYQWYQIKLEQGFEVHYQEDLIITDFNSTYHSYSLHHQMILKDAKVAWLWNNDIGLEKLKGGRNIFKQPLFFYRTGIDIGKSWKNVGIYASPFLQVDFARHLYDVGRPINYGIQAKVAIHY